MPRKRLTEEGVRKLKPPPEAKQIDYYDAVMPGLVLRVNYGGRKVWRALFYVKGAHKKTGKTRTEPRTHPLGKYPIMNLKAAREAAQKFLLDPKKALTEVGTGSFREVAADFIKRHVEPSKLRTQAEIVRCINKYVMPVWGDQMFRELKRTDVKNLLNKIEDDHGVRQADVVLSILRRMMNRYQIDHDDYVSPIIPGMSTYKADDHKRSRILSDEELRALWKATETGTFGALIRVLLLTAQRKDKVVNMKWEDIVDGEWRIPTEHREKSNAEMLRLPQLVLDIIEKQPRIADNPYVFALSGKGAPNSFIKPKEELDKRMREQVPDMKHWVLHDLRRTARSLLSRTDVLPHVSEQVLGHSIRGVQGVYDRHKYDDEKEAALRKLACLVEKIVNPPDNVVVTPRRV